MPLENATYSATQQISPGMLFGYGGSIFSKGSEVSH